MTTPRRTEWQMKNARTAPRPTVPAEDSNKSKLPHDHPFAFTATANKWGAHAYL
jgi:hypothetical protein